MDISDLEGPYTQKQQMTVEFAKSLDQIKITFETTEETDPSAIEKFMPSAHELQSRLDDVSTYLDEVLPNVVRIRTTFEKLEKNVEEINEEYEKDLEESEQQHG